MSGKQKYRFSIKCHLKDCFFTWQLFQIPPVKWINYVTEVKVVRTFSEFWLNQNTNTALGNVWGNYLKEITENRLLTIWILDLIQFVHGDFHASLFIGVEEDVLDFSGRWDAWGTTSETDILWILGTYEFCLYNTCSVYIPFPPGWG